MVDAPIAVTQVIHAAGLGAVERVRPAGAGRRNDVWMVETSVGRVVVRLLQDDVRLRMEARVLALAADAGLPVASCLWSAVEPRPVMIQTALPGSRLADIEAPASLRDELAAVLRRIHAIPIERGFGTLDADLHGSDDTLAGWFTGRVRDEAASAPTSPADRRLLDAALTTLADGDALLSRQAPGLVHGDLQPSNVLVSDGRITGILDWEAAKSGPPGFDFGWWDWWSEAFRAPWTTDEVLEAYDPDGEVDRVEMDAIRELVQVRIWTRELIAGTRGDDRHRASAARAALTARL